MKISKIALVLVSLVLPIAATAQMMDYIMQSQYSETKGSVLVNGFLVSKNDATGSSTVNTYLTPYLSHGINSIIVNSIPINTPSDYEYNGMEVKIYTEPAKTEVLTWKTTGGNYYLYPSQVKVSSLIHGSATNYFNFKSMNGTYLFSCKLVDSLPWLPIKIGFGYIGPKDLKNVEIVFTKEGTEQYVSYGTFDFVPRQYVELSLTPDKVLKGAEWLSDHSFDTITIHGMSDELFEPKIGSISMYSRQKAPSEATLTLEAFLETEPIWNQAENIENLSEQQIDQLWRFLEDLHQRASSGDADKFVEPFKSKLKEIAVLAHNGPETYVERMKKEYDVVRKLPGWVVLPIKRENLRYYKTNDKVIKIEDADGDDLIRGPELNVPDGGVAKFRVVLYLSYIDGKWVVVR